MIAIQRRIFYIRGMKILVLEHVFPPIKTYSTELLLDVIDELSSVKNDLIICDIGTGTGILAIYAAIKGFKVIASDISKIAVKNAKINASLNNVNIDIREGDLFDCYTPKELFDVIFFNPPYFPMKIKDDFSVMYACGERYNTILRFLKQAKLHLKKDGKIFITLSSLIDEDFLLACARKLGYTIKKIREIKALPKECISLYRLSLSS